MSLISCIFVNEMDGADKSVRVALWSNDDGCRFWSSGVCKRRRKRSDSTKSVLLSSVASRIVCREGSDISGAVDPFK